MKGKLIGGILFCFAFAAYGQDAAYSFKGHLDQALILKIENDCKSITGVKSAKVRYKEDSERGEILIDLIDLDNNRTEGSNQVYSPIDIKALLVSNGLEPLDYRSINQ